MNTFASENGGRKRLRFARAGVLVRRYARTLERLEMAAQKQVTTLPQLEKHLELSAEERSGVLLSGDKLALAVTPTLF
jgi:hypothetical protein